MVRTTGPGFPWGALWFYSQWPAAYWRHTHTKSSSESLLAVFTLWWVHVVSSSCAWCVLIIMLNQQTVKQWSEGETKCNFLFLAKISFKPITKKRRHGIAWQNENTSTINTRTRTNRLNLTCLDLARFGLVWFGLARSSQVPNKVNWSNETTQTRENKD